MKIVDHVLNTAKTGPLSPNKIVGASIVPKVLVLMPYGVFHRGQGDSPTDGFANLTLRRDGSISQEVSFNQKSSFAGKAFWRGYSDLNAHAIGIYIENYGCARTRDGLPVTRYEERCELSPLDMDQWQHVGSSWGQVFTREQLDALDDLIPLIVNTYNLREVVEHAEIAIPTGRVHSLGPLFPLTHFKSYGNPASGACEGRYIVVCANLNVRGGPGPAYEIVHGLRRGESVKVLKFEGGWALINYDTTRAWVHESFLMKA